MARYTEALTVERGGFRIKVPETWWEFDVRRSPATPGAR